MDLSHYLEAVFLGLVEGLTEFLPISSTGHILMLGHFMGFEGPPGRVFEIAIQLGAILAVVWLYREKLFSVALRLPRDPSAQRFTLNLLVAFLPALVVGALAADAVDALLETPAVIAVTWVLGGIVILAVERMRHSVVAPEVDDVRPWLALRIGLAQLAALVPGVSRSGATIMGALLFGASRKAATEFSFFLAIPTMVAATAYKLFQARNDLDADGLALIGVGFLVSFLSALAVVRILVAFVSRYGFAPFAWYRIVVGIVAGAALWLVG